MIANCSMVGRACGDFAYPAPSEYVIGVTAFSHKTFYHKNKTFSHKTFSHKNKTVSKLVPHGRLVVISMEGSLELY